MSRSFCSIEYVLSIDPHPNADALEIARIKGWQVVTRKGDFKAGDLAIFCEIDTLLPAGNPHWDFISSSPGDYKQVKLRTLRGIPSRGLLLPVSILGTVPPIGTCVDQILGVRLPEEGPTESGQAPFPSNIPRTQQDRIQNLSLADLHGAYSVTEKLDGQSVTIFRDRETVRYCTRNCQVFPGNPEASRLFRAVKYLPIGALPEGYAFQGELVGPGVQNNPYKLKANKVFIFSVFNIDQQRYLPYPSWADMAENYSFDLVPDLGIFRIRPDTTLEDLTELSTGYSHLANVRREGVVLRAVVGHASFKIINYGY